MLSDRDIREQLGGLSSVENRPAPEQAPPDLSRFHRALVGAALGIAVLWTAGFAFLLACRRRAPHAADPRTGHIHPFHLLGTVAYLTGIQHGLVEATLILLPVATLLLVAVVLRSRPARQKKKVEAW